MPRTPPTHTASLLSGHDHCGVVRFVHHDSTAQRCRAVWQIAEAEFIEVCTRQSVDPDLPPVAAHGRRQTRLAGVLVRPCGEV